MNVKLKNVLLLSLLTTLVALVLSFLVLPENSGYAGLFFIAVSPLFFIVFIIWTLILVPVTEKKEGLIRSLITFLSTFVLLYLMMIVGMSILSSDNRNYNLDTFFTDSADLFSEVAALLFTLAISTVYTALFRYILKKK